MIYLWPTCSSMMGMHPSFGVMVAPAMGSVSLGIQEGRVWACDNEAFTRPIFEPERLFGFLNLHQSWRSQCLFVVCPDVVGNAIETINKYLEWAHIIKCQDWPVAFVAQDGQESLDFPLDFDWLFIGGTTE